MGSTELFRNGCTCDGDDVPLDPSKGALLPDGLYLPPNFFAKSSDSHNPARAKSKHQDEQSRKGYFLHAVPP